MKNLYRILDLPRDCTPEQIKRRFRELSKRYHPDVLGGNPDAKDTLRYLDIKTAYEVLSDPTAREFYDRTGDTDETARKEEIEGTITDIASVLITVLPTGENFIEAIADKIRLGIAKLGGEEDAEKKSLERIRALRRRIRFEESEGRRDLLGEMLAEKEAESESTLANIARNIALSGEALIYLTSFKDLPPLSLVFRAADNDPDRTEIIEGIRCLLCGEVIGERGECDCTCPFCEDNGCQHCQV